MADGTAVDQEDLREGEEPALDENADVDDTAADVGEDECQDGDDALEETAGCIMDATLRLDEEVVVDPSLVLDPYKCIAVKNRKYVLDCEEVYLVKEGGEVISENFRHFLSLKVLWLSGNRLSTIHNLQHNFRIRELYLDNNRLASLDGIKSFKFLQVLFASNNQLADLSEQTNLLCRFNFLRKLELFGNPVAEEANYRLRTIYAVPQAEHLDRLSVKQSERRKAKEVVPYFGSVRPPRRERGKAVEPWKHYSFLEGSCLRVAKEILDKRRREMELKDDLELNCLGRLAVTQPLPKPKVRNDFFMQTFLNATREVDDQGMPVLRVVPSWKKTTIGTY